MASINGVEIKNLKFFQGHEYESVAQGTVYYKGRKLGFWSQDAHGGCDNFEFDCKIFENAFYQWKSVLRNTDSYKYLDVDSFMCDIVYLADMEKKYKMGLKKGWPYIWPYMQIIYPLATGYGDAYNSKNTNMPPELVQESKKNISKSLGTIESNLKFICLTISSPEDFNIIVGTEKGLNEEIELEKQKKAKLKAEVEERNKKEKENAERLKNNGRFQCIDGKGYTSIIKDLQTGRSIEVDKLNSRAIMEALIKLFL